MDSNNNEGESLRILPRNGEIFYEILSNKFLVEQKKASAIEA